VAGWANLKKKYGLIWFGFMLFNAFFNNISVISWQSEIYWWRKAENPEKTTQKYEKDISCQILDNKH